MVFFAFYLILSECQTRHLSRAGRPVGILSHFGQRVHWEIKLWCLVKTFCLAIGVLAEVIRKEKLWKLLERKKGRDKVAPEFDNSTV